MITRSSQVRIGAALVALLAAVVGQGCRSHGGADTSPVSDDTPAAVDTTDDHASGDAQSDAQSDDKTAGGTDCITADGAPYESDSC